MTAADAFFLMEEAKKTLREEIQQINQRMTNMHRSLINMFEILESLSSDLVETSVRRI